MEAQQQKRTVNWTPKCFVKTGKDGAADVPLYSGHIVLEVPDNEFMCDILAELSHGDPDEIKKQGATFIMAAYKKAKHLIVGAEVVRLKDQVKLDLDAVKHEQGLRYLPMEFGAKVLGEGFGPGEE